LAEASQRLAPKLGVVRQVIKEALDAARRGKPADQGPLGSHESVTERLHGPKNR
jgi:hypothetical protein